MNLISIFPVHILGGLGLKDGPTSILITFLIAKMLACIILISVFVLCVQLLGLLHFSQSTYLQKDTDY